MKRIILFSIFVLLVGCKAAPSDVAVKGGQATGMINAYAEASIRDLDRAKPHADPAGKELIAGARENQLNIQGQTGLVEKWFKEAVDFGQKQYYTIGNIIERKVIACIWLLTGFWTLGLVFRIVALFVTGPLGAPMAFGGSAILSTLPVVGSWVNETASNLHLRGITPSGQSDPPPMKGKRA